tara:strand:- start:311 stop:589 length:279 start_codon:yes stop_codon:yes gene_type:complete
MIGKATSKGLKQRKNTIVLYATAQLKEIKLHTNHQIVATCIIKNASMNGLTKGQRRSCQRARCAEQIATSILNMKTRIVYTPPTIWSTIMWS